VKIIIPHYSFKSIRTETLLRAAADRIADDGLPDPKGICADLRARAKWIIENRYDSRRPFVEVHAIRSTRKPRRAKP